MDCIDLREQFGDRYRITFDPVIDPRGKWRDLIDPWLHTIECRYGTIYPYGTKHLAIDIDNHSFIARQVAELSGSELVQDGDFEKTVKFPLDQFDAVAAIVKPHKRPRYSEERRQRLRQNMVALRENFPMPSPQIRPQKATEAASR